MNLTKEQKAIVDDQSKILLVNAYAGTGKTSTLVEYCKKRQGKKILYLAYNSSMAKEAVKKFKGLNVECITIHSLAYQDIGNKYKDRLEGNVSLKPFHLTKYFRDSDHKKTKMLMNAFQGFIFSADTIEETMLKFKKQMPPEVLNKLPILWKDIIEDSKMPFEHDFYLKLYQLSKPVLEYDFILVDEAQDLNPTMFDIIVTQRQNKTTLVLIGDSYQKIYGFRNCINGLELLRKDKEAKTLFLSQTFRCPKNVISIANPYLKLAGAQVNLVSQKEPIKSNENEKKQKCIICRTNAKIFMFALLNRDKKIHFVGGIKSYKFQDMIDLMLLFSKNKDCKNYIKNPFFRNFSNSSEIIEYAKESNDVEIKAKISMLSRLLNEKVNPFDFLKNIKDFPANEADYIITSAHKSKGLEWDHIFLEDDFLDIEEELAEKRYTVSTEEVNLLYVAITRAKVSFDSAKDYLHCEATFNEAKKNFKFID